MIAKSPASYILVPYFLDEFEEEMIALAQAGWKILRADLGPGRKQERMIEIYRMLRDAVAQEVKAARMPVSVAGDCCSTIGFLAGLQAASLNPTLIWFDAHGDFNTWETTPSGFLGGMPLAMLVGRGQQLMPEGAGLKTLPENKVILTDARDLDPGERKNLLDSAVKHYPDVAELLEAPLPEGPIWIHFDVDVLNTAELPAVGYPAAGGPASGTVRAVLERLAGSGQIAAVSLSNWDMEMDLDGRSQELSMELLFVLTGA